MSLKYMTSQELRERIEYGRFESLELRDPMRHREMLNAVRRGDFDWQEFVDPDLCVAMFCRPAAGCTHRYGLRTLQSLYESSVYLLEGIFDKVWEISKTSLSMFMIYYSFAEDRFRAIRQELVMYDSEDWITIEILENAVEFYVCSHYVSRILSQRSENRKIIEHAFDQKLNTQRLNESLTTLLNLYDIYNDDKWSTKRRTMETIGIILNFFQDENTFRNRKSYYLLDRFWLYESIYKNLHQKNYRRLLGTISQNYHKYPLVAMAFHSLCLDNVHSAMIESLMKACKSKCIKLIINDALIEMFLPKPNLAYVIPKEVKHEFQKYIQHKFATKGFRYDEDNGIDFNRSEKPVPFETPFEDVWLGNILGRFALFDQ